MKRPGFVVPAREKVAFGLGDFAINIAYTAIGFYYIYFLVNVARLPAPVAGAIFLVARFWDAIMNFVAGRISDRVDTRMGRRRPFILASCLPVGILFALLWAVPSGGIAERTLYFVAVTVLFNTVFSFVVTPYNALMPELSQDYDERTNISGFRMALSICGNLIAAAGGSFIVDSLFGGSANYRRSYPVMGAAFGGIVVVALLLTFLGTHERVKPERQERQRLIRTIKSVLALREFRLVLGMFIFNMIGQDLIQTLFVFYLKDVIGIGEDLTFVLMGIPLVTAVAAVPLWVFAGERLGKRKAYMGAAAYFFCALAFALFAPVGDLAFVILIAVLAGVGFSASAVIPFSIIPDVIEIDELENGTRREGIFYGTSMLLYKCLSAIVISLTTAALGWFGYSESASLAEPASARLAIRLFLGLAPGIFFLVSAVFVKLLPITKERFDQAKKAIGERASAPEDR
jgi:GPH family glycoside/pentoside/hexuronide:cation symporter